MNGFSLKARTTDSADSFIQLKVPDSIYFMGICGVAMASLAVYLKQQGFKVSGSDKDIYPPMSDLLKKANIPVFPYDQNNIKTSIKLIIVGNVISKNHLEISFVQKLKIPYLSLPEFLEQRLLSKTKNIVIAGTHGKSTSTALMSHVGEVADQNPSFFVGAIQKNFSSSFRSTDSPWFIIEGDEYDTSFFAKRPKFLYYKPFSVLLTGIEFDHGDIYNHLDEIIDLFCELVKKIPAKGSLVVFSENKNLEKVIQCSPVPVMTYGISRGDYRIKNRFIEKDRQVFDICYKKESYPCSIPLFGKYNALNALGVFALSQSLDWPIEKVLQGLKTFRGIQRRLQWKGRFRGAEIYEDFAHHPTAVEACLSALKEKSLSKRLVAFFEPRSFTSRLNVFQDSYVKAFSHADLIFIAPVYDNSHIPEDQRLSIKKLIQDLKGRGKPARYYDSFEALEKGFLKELSKEDIVVFMSSGAFGGFLKKLEEKMDK